MISYTKGILSGRKLISDKQKYMIADIAIAFVHILLFCIFLYLDIRPLYIFNIGSVSAYLLSIIIIRKEKYFSFYLVTYFEIILHSVVATICIGWRFGFAQYIIAVVPVGYYCCYTIKTVHKKMFTATLSAFVAVVIFLWCRVFVYFHDPFYAIENYTVEIALYFFNSLCTFFFLIAYSIVYIIEIKTASEQLKHQNSVLNKLANIDPLTGLYNRRSMEIFINQALQSEISFSLIMGDIDNFKSVNDTYGHEFGDVVLRDIAQIIVKEVNEHGYVCRYGGEEILILINNCSNEKIFQIAESIRNNVEKHSFVLDERAINCTITLGIAEYKTGSTIEEIISLADKRLYNGKRSGKNKVVYQ